MGSALPSGSYCHNQTEEDQLVSRVGKLVGVGKTPTRLVSEVLKREKTLSWYHKSRGEISVFLLRILEFVLIKEALSHSNI